jgi:hypothetical protein
MTAVESIYVKKGQELPAYIARAFKEIVSDSHRNLLITELRSAEWTLEAISIASGLTRERVRQISVAHEDDGTELDIEIPEPPLKPTRQPAVYVEPDPKTLERLLELQPYAQRVRSNGKKYREEAEEYTKLLNHAHVNEGVTLYRLAKRLGVTHGALRFRLVRYGYKKPVTATSKVYTPILKENRIK